MTWLCIYGECNSRLEAEWFAAKYRLEYIKKGIMLDIRPATGKTASYYVWRSTVKSDYDTPKMVDCDTEKLVPVVDFFRKHWDFAVRTDKVNYGVLSQYEATLKPRKAVKV